jgi:upstream activation factor subunit UAF30
MAKKASKSPAKGGAKKSAAKKPAGAKTKRTPNAAFMKPMRIGAALQPIVGNGPMPRTEVTKKVWEYIKKNKLQDSREKRKINADANLSRALGGKRTVDMFEMTRLINQQLS